MFGNIDDDIKTVEENEDWSDSRAAYLAGLQVARQWQPDARSALIDLTEYPPAHINPDGRWEIQFWSPGVRVGLTVWLDKALQPVGQAEWGAFYQKSVRRVGQEVLGPQGFQFAPEIGTPGPDGLSFIFKRPSPTYTGQTDFVDIQISTSVMLTPPPRRFTINLIRSTGDRPQFGQPGGFETRLGSLLPDKKPDFWWSFKSEVEYESKLWEALDLVVKYGLAAML